MTNPYLVLHKINYKGLLLSLDYSLSHIMEELWIIHFHNYEETLISIIQ